jgi:hypothetical protein
MREAPHADARTRVRQRIKRLLEDRGKTNREFGKWLGHKDQWVSNLLAGKFALSLDELDRAALFFHVPPGELVRVSDEPWELNAGEMRTVRALRMLPPVVRDHVITLADYLVGATPEEVTILKGVRELSDEDVRVLESWIRVRIQLQDSALATLEHRAPDPPTPPAGGGTRLKLHRRTRGRRPTNAE